MAANPNKYRLLFIALAGVVCAVETAAQSTAPADVGSNEPDLVHLPSFVLFADRVANDGPASTFSAPVTALRFEPRVDLQTRNFGEAQGDVTIRGGTFEGTAVQVGGLTVFDPQTGHYAAELPIAPAMLGTARVATGLDHSFAALNATAGTIEYEWREIRSGGSVAAAVGNGSLHRESARLAQVFRDEPGRGARLAAEVDVAFSAAEGTIADGDHDFSRVAGRVEIGSGGSRTQLFAGYQAKFFGWPNLYTPFGVAETENLQTTLFVVAQEIERDDFRFDASAYHRRNKDDYEFNRRIPGQFNPYQHETRVSGLMARAEIPAGAWRVHLRGEAARDEIDSTALTAGRFDSRTYWKLGGLATRRWPAGDRTSWETRVGATFDDTNRERSRVSPLAEIAWESGAGLRWYAQYSENTRVPGYTALNSPAGGGLFRGNPDLGREVTRNLETGIQLRAADWSVHAAVFGRRDDPLVDWTFSAATPNARSAREVEIDVLGFELVAARTWGPCTITGGYTGLDKNADYRGEPVDASFYALNFARHRLTLAGVVDLGAGFEARMDNEYRIQEKNLLRTIGGDSALLSALGIYWRPENLTGLELSLVIDNLWQSDFQELPAVPAPGRQITFGAAWSW